MRKMILIYESNKDYEAIENAFNIIKRGGSRLKSKEDMCKLVIEKEIGIANILFHLTSTLPKGNSDKSEEHNTD